ncbi:hypothetical protein C1T17_06600 [Sphingobium sp. SCG-1]|nr:hypothetical protein C1T17_06600 [Sphingobium sp. SCG-1]
MLDRVAIEQVLLRERFGRETHDFDTEQACFTPDAFIEASWFKGSAKDFVDQGRKQVANARGSSRLISFDSLSPVVIWVNGDRAIAEGSTAVHQVLPIQGIEAHMTSFTRIMSRLQRIDGEWLIAAKHAVYIRDVLEPMNPKEVPEIDTEKLKQYRPSYRHLSYVLSLAGIPLRDDLPGVDRPEAVTALRVSEREWLAQG